MSADNGIFIFQHPEGGYGVVHWTLSAMPGNLPELIETKTTCYGDVLHRFDDRSQALALARRMSREFYDRRDILEYGIVDWSDTSYADLVAPYLEEVVPETDEQMAARYQALYTGD